MPRGIGIAFSFNILSNRINYAFKELRKGSALARSLTNSASIFSSRSKALSFLAFSANSAWCLCSSVIASNLALALASALAFFSAFLASA